MQTATEALSFESPSPQRRWSRWILWIGALLLALLLHSLFFLTRVEWSPPRSPAPVELKPFDRSQLDTLRDQWKKMEKEPPRQLLLDKDPSQPSEETAPDNARYSSNRNTRVEKEQRARKTDVLPAPDSRRQAPSVARSAKKAAPPPSASRSLPKSLSGLGVPLHLNAAKASASGADREAKEATKRQAAGAANRNGGDQALLDPEVPEGSENVLNTRQSVYYSFYSRLYEAVAPLWKSRLREARDVLQRGLPTGTYETSADVVMDSQGNVLEVRILQSSNVPVLDEAARYPWLKIARFPNPPQGLLDEHQQVHMLWSFTFRIANEGGLLFHATPPREPRE